MVELPDGVGYGQVQWLATKIDNDSTAADGSSPLLQPVTGGVLFVPTIEYVKVVSTRPLMTIFLRPVNGDVGADGLLRDSTGQLGVDLLANDSVGLDVAPMSWHWTASYQLDGVSIKTHQLDVLRNGTIDLALVQPQLS